MAIAQDGSTQTHRLTTGSSGTYTVTTAGTNRLLSIIADSTITSVSGGGLSWAQVGALRWAWADATLSSQVITVNYSGTGSTNFPLRSCLTVWSGAANLAPVSTSFTDYADGTGDTSSYLHAGSLLLWLASASEITAGFGGLISATVGNTMLAFTGYGVRIVPDPYPESTDYGRLTSLTTSGAVGLGVGPADNVDQSASLGSVWEIQDAAYSPAGTQPIIIMC